MSSIENLGPGDFGRGIKKRLPICFCLDISGSMLGERIDSLNNALRTYFDTISEDTAAQASVDIAVVTYGGVVDVLQGFAPINKIEPPLVSVNRRSFTPMGEGILTSLKLLDIRKQGYKDRGFKYYQPWLILITDGKPEGPGAEQNFEEAVAQLNRLEMDDKIVVFNIGVGEDADLWSLKRLSVKRQAPISSDERNLKSYFEFLGSSSKGVVGGLDISALYQDIVADSSGNAGIAQPTDGNFDINKWVL